MFLNELSEPVEMCFCLTCQKNDLVMKTTDGKLFHIAFKLTVITETSGTAEAVECLGPFAYSEPPTKEEEMVMLYSNMSEECDRQHYAEILEPREQAEETDIEQLASLTFENKYFPSLEEILIDNIRPGDVSLFNIYMQ